MVNEGATKIAGLAGIYPGLISGGGFPLLPRGL